MYLLTCPLLFNVGGFIYEQASGWTKAIQIGVTALDPAFLGLPYSLSEVSEDTWMLSGCSVNHSGDTTIKKNGMDLDGLTEGDCVGVMRTSSGELHLYVNGKDQGKAATGIPTNVYAALDMFGLCEQVSVFRDFVVEAGMST